jgi:drug/metabolite transporter (DMT)-like permease
LIPYYKALKLDDVSRVAPLFQFIPVFTLILSTIFLKETLSLRQTVGLILVVAAGLLLSAEKIEGKFFRPRKAMWLMILSSFMYSCVLILFRFVVREAGYWTTLSWQYMGIGIGAIFLLFLARIRNSIKSQAGQLKSSLPLISANNGIAIVADMSGSYAISLVSVPLVNIIKEDIRKSTIIQKVASIFVIFVGLFLVYS